MAYIAPIHKSSSVRFALEARLLSADEHCLVIAKTNRLEIWRLADDHLTLFHSSPVHGNICMLRALQPRDSPTEILFVGTDRFRYFTASWSPETRQMKTEQLLEDDGEQFVRDVVTKNQCLVDPSGRFVVMLLWSGVLSVMSLPKRKSHNKPLEALDFLDQARISELHIKDATFLHSDTGHPRIAFLYQTQPDVPEAKLVVYRLCCDDRDTEVSRFDPLKDREISINVKDPGAAILIPVERVEVEKRHHFRNPTQPRAHLGGLIVVGETKLLYLDDVTKATVEAAFPSANIFVAWAKYDATHYFLADDYGGLHLVTILVDYEANNAVRDLITTPLGRTSRASQLVFMEGNLLFVGSHYGDSQLLRVQLEEERPVLDVLQTLPNIAPILDFTVMDMGNRESDSQLGNEYSSGQARIVTGSGAHKDGSLRSVRSGVGLEDIGIIADLDGIRGLFSVVSHESTVVDTLLASFVTETRAFTFTATGSIEEVEAFQGLDLASRSILVTNVLDNYLLQVTESTVSVIDGDGGVTVSSWHPPEGQLITTASTNGRWVLVAVDGRRFVSLNLSQGLEEVASKDCPAKEQIACLHASPHLLDTGVVGYWSTGSVCLVNLATLEASRTTSLRRTEDKAIVPRDIVLARIHPSSVAGPILFVSMDDGEVVNFSVSASGVLSSRRSVVLGTRQARFHVLPQPGGFCNIFVTSEHSSLIYGAEGRAVFSAITAEAATYVCPFDAAAFPDSLAVATESQLKISRVDRQRQSHIRSLEMGENVRCIAYSVAEKLFALGCIKRELVKGVEKASSSLKLVDEVVFKPLGQPFNLGDGELVECVVRAQLPDSYGNLAERFIVGTRSLPPSNNRGGAATDSAGRILVFGVDEDRSPYQIVSHTIKSGCRRLAVLDDMVVAVLTKSVVLARYEELSSTWGRLEKVASYQTTTYAIDLAVEGNLIAVADLMKSMALVRYEPPKKAKQDGGGLSEPAQPAQLVEVCRHYSSVWGTAVCHLDENTWLESDGDGNLMTLDQNEEGPTPEDRRRMRVLAEFGLGESVNRIQKITVETSKNAPIIPKAFLATVEGSIYLFGLVAQPLQDLLLRFQAALADRVKTLGEISFHQYRSFRNAERESDGPVRFLDGEMLERFLGMDEEEQAEVCEGLGPNVESMRTLVEQLKSMH